MSIDETVQAIYEGMHDATCLDHGPHCEEHAGQIRDAIRVGLLRAGLDDEAAATPEERERIRREMAAELSDWIRDQANRLRGATTSGNWKQIADKIDPRKVPSRNGLRSYWNQGDTW